MEKLFALQRFILSVPLDEVTKVDKDKETRCLEKKSMKRRTAKARCREVRVTWSAPGPRGGGSALPLSLFYPLAAVRLSGQR